MAILQASPASYFCIVKFRVLMFNLLSTSTSTFTVMNDKFAEVVPGLWLQNP